MLDECNSEDLNCNVLLFLRNFQLESETFYDTILIVSEAAGFENVRESVLDHTDFWKGF